MDPRIINLGCSEISFTSRPPCLLTKEFAYPLDMTLGGPQTCLDEDR